MMKRPVFAFFLSALFPFLLTLLAVRLAFTEAFVEFLYKKVELPPDPMPYDTRLSIAKLGLRSVLSEDGMEEFKNSGLFNQREIRHMEDVKKLLGFLFNTLYIALPLWILGVIGLRNLKDIGKVFLLGSILFEIFVLFVILASFINYDWLFESFHNLFFDPYSWRFRDEDMLLRVYPMDFWYKATIYTAVFAFFINFILQVFGFVMFMYCNRKNRLER